MDSACATLFHSNVNKVSPNRTILAGEKVGIACLLPKQPGVDWYGFLFPAFLWLWLLQVWACWCCTSCYAEVSFVRSTWYKVPGAVPWLLQPLSCTAPEESGRFCRGATDPPTCLRWQEQGCGCQEGTAVLLPSSQACQEWSTGSNSHGRAKAGCFQLGLVSLHFGVNFNVT